MLSVTVRMQVEWSDHPRDLVTRLSALLASHSMLDITLAAEGRFIKAHKVILAASSKYFEVNISFIIINFTVLKIQAF